jgi:predicted metal-dependent hydrolase
MRGAPGFSEARHPRIDSRRRLHRLVGDVRAMPDELPIRIRRRKGTRHLRVGLDHGNAVVVSAPWHCSDREARKFVEQHRDWIENQRSSMPRPRTLSDWLGEHPRMSASGEEFHVRVERDGAARPRYRFESHGAGLVLALPAEGSERDLLKLARVFAADALHCRTAYHARCLDLAFSRLSVRDQSSRWGSCSGKGALSLNWRLVLLPPELQDYVILHELAHLSEMNHSARYWALLDRYDPDRHRHEAELDAVTPALMRVGRGEG